MPRLMLSSLPPLDRRLLCTIERLVPGADREEWSRAWQAELWHLHRRRRSSRRHNFALMTDVGIGLVRDAFWLRTESWRCMLHGTAAFCLGGLIAGSLLCTVFGLAFAGGWHALADELRAPIMRCVASAPLVLFVSLATASRRHMEASVSGQALFRMRRILFFLGKISQVFTLAFLLSMAACSPLRLLLPGTVDLYQMFGFVLCSLVGMRWALRDQEQRCKQCLQSLAAIRVTGLLLAPDVQLVELPSDVCCRARAAYVPIVPSRKSMRLIDLGKVIVVPFFRAHAW